jgi:hypothetical protein
MTPAKPIIRATTIKINCNAVDKSVAILPLLEESDSPFVRTELFIVIKSEYATHTLPYHISTDEIISPLLTGASKPVILF